MGAGVGCSRERFLSWPVCFFSFLLESEGSTICCSDETRIFAIFLDFANEEGDTEKLCCGARAALVWKEPEPPVVKSV